MNKKVLEKLKKLVAHAESARAIGNAAEASAFDEQVKVLLEKHRITMDDVELHAEQTDDIGMEFVWANPRELEKWHYPLQAVIGIANECLGIFSEDGLMGYVGVPAERLKAARQLRYFDSLFVRKGETYRSPRPSISSSTVSNSYYSATFYFQAGPDPGMSYVTGLVEGFCAQLMRDLTEAAFQKTEAEKDLPQSHALVFTDRKRIEKKAERIINYMNSKVAQQDQDGERLEIPNEPVLVELSCYEQGRLDGAKIKLTDLEIDEGDAFGEGLVKK